jgi:hypothetical protein
MIRSSFLQFLLISVVILIMTGLGYAGWKFKGKKEIKSEPILITLPTLEETDKPEEEKPEVSEIDISDWKTYRNEEFEFEVKYPKNFRLYSPNEQFSSITSYDMFDLKYEKGNMEGLKLQIIINQQKQTTVQKVFELLGQETEFGESIFFKEKLENYVIFRNIKWHTDQKGILGGIFLPSHAIYDPTYGSLVVFNIWDPSRKFNETINQILSTFKFLD